MTGPSALTVVYCGEAPPTSAPATSTPPTSAPLTSTPLTSTPATSTPPTSAPLTSTPPTSGAIGRIISACHPDPVHAVGPRPGKSIDSLLSGRVLVVGDDADLAAVVLRLLRRDLLADVEIAYAAVQRTPATARWSLPHGEPAVHLARRGEVDLVTLVRDDVGGVLIARGELGPVNGTVYVDENRVLRGPARRLLVEPDRQKGLSVTVARRGPFGLRRRPVTTLGRAVQIGTVPTTVVSDGVEYPRRMDRWTFYKHTQPLRLVRGVL